MHLVGFITKKFVTMRGHMDVKKYKGMTSIKVEVSRVSSMQNDELHVNLFHLIMSTAFDSCCVHIAFISIEYVMRKYGGINRDPSAVRKSACVSQHGRSFQQWH